MNFNNWKLCWLMEEQDLYKTEEEALAKAKEIGCVGTH